MRPVNLRHLEHFCAVVETGSTVGAAQKLNLSQPAISRSISLLQAEVGFTLFERWSGGLSPTADGQMLYQEARALFDQSLKLSKVIGRISRSEYGQLRIAAFPALAATCMPGVIAAYIEDKPTLKVSLHGSGWRQIITGLETGRLDLAIMLRPLENAMVHCEPLCSYPAVCAIPRGHDLSRKDTVTLDDLSGQNVVHLDPDDGSRDHLDELLTSRKVETQASVVASLSTSICQFVAAGAGIAVLDAFVARAFDHAVEIRPFEEALNYECWIAWPKVPERSSATTAFADHLIKVLPEQLAGDV